MVTTATPGAVNLDVGGKTVSLPVVTGSEGEVGIDIGQLRAKTRPAGKHGDFRLARRNGECAAGLP